MKYGEYLFLRENFGLEPLGCSHGRKYASNSTPDAVYKVEDSEINFYDYDASLSDIIHPYVPTGDYLVETNVETRDTGFHAFLIGSMSSFEEVDSFLMQGLNRKSSDNVVKKIL